MTLTQTATVVKQIITVSVAALVLGLTAFIGYRIWVSYYLAHLPPVEEAPDNKFGLLPSPNFPKSSVSSSNFSYSLDTVTGGLPKVGVDPGFEKIIRVYFMPQTFATLLSSEKSEALAEKFGITSSPEILSETEYRFKDQGKDLTVDLDSGNFSYINSAAVPAETGLDDDQKLAADFKETLSALGLLKDDLKTGRNKVILLKSTPEGIVPVGTRSEAKAAQISLWPAPLDKKPIFTADFNNALVTATVLGVADELDNYLSLDFIYYPVDATTFATYLLKTAESAFADLQNGKGIVVTPPDKPQVSITSVYLGYYLPENYSPYLQPIYIFEGPNFVAYTAAIENSGTPNQ